MPAATASVGDLIVTHVRACSNHQLLERGADGAVGSPGCPIYIAAITGGVGKLDRLVKIKGGARLMLQRTFVIG